MSEKLLPEFELIRLLSQSAPMFLGGDAVGIGDDCAVVPLGDQKLLLTIDTLTEGRHFDLRYFDPFSLGWKLLAVNLSDVAAMGGKPLVARVALQLRDGIDNQWCTELYRGIQTLAERFQVSLVGGDTSFGRELTLTLALDGVAEKAPILRGGAQAGDDIWLSGSVGNSGAGLKLLQAGIKIDLDDPLLTAHLRPDPRVEMGRALSEHGLASALIDVSDGLLQDLLHIARASALQILLDEAAIPLSPAVKRQVLSLPETLVSGEDYELAFCAPPAKRQMLSDLSVGCSLTRIGVVRDPGAAQAGVLLKTSSGEVTASDYLAAAGLPPALGFQHF